MSKIPTTVKEPIAFKAETYTESIDGDIATIKYDDKEIFAESIDGIDADTVKKVFNHSKTYINDATQAAGEKAITVLESNKDVNKVVTMYPFGGTGTGMVTVVTHREKEIRNPKTGDTITRPAMSVQVHAAEFKATKSRVRAMEARIAEALAK